MANKQIAEFSAIASVLDSTLFAAQPSLDVPNVKPTGAQVKAYVKSGFVSADVTDFSSSVNALISAATINAATLGGQNGAYYLARANHTGTQLAATISDFAATTRSTVLTGYASTTGTITAADTVLSAINKLNGNTQNLSRVNSLNSKTGALTLAGTANQVDVNNAGPSTISLSLPQNIDGAAIPGFAGIYLSSAETTNQIAGDVNLSATDKVYKMFRTLKDLGTWQWQLQVGNENGVDFSGIRLGSIDWEPTTIGFTGFWVKQDNAYVAGQTGTFKGLEYRLNNGDPYTNEFDATLTDASLINRLYADNRYVMSGSLAGYAQLAVANTFTDLNTFEAELVAESTAGHALNIRDKVTDPHGYIQYIANNGDQKGYIGYPAPNSAWLTLHNNIGDLVYSATSSYAHRFTFDGADAMTLTSTLFGYGVPLDFPNISGSNLGVIRCRSTASGGTSDWVAGVFGGSSAAAQPAVVMGAMNGYATVAAHNSTLTGWRPMVLNGVGDLALSGHEVWVPNTFRPRVIASFNGLGYVPFSESPRCSIAPSVGDDLANKTYVDSVVVPSWATFFGENTNTDLYLRFANSYNFACKLGMILNTGVYSQHTGGDFTNAEWFVGLAQTTTNDYDECGIAQLGVGSYLKCFRRNQTAAGLAATFEGRPNKDPGDPPVNRDDLRFLVDDTAMIKSTEPRLWFYNTNATGVDRAHFKLTMETDGYFRFYGEKEWWRDPSPVLGLSAYGAGGSDLISYVDTPNKPSAGGWSATSDARMKQKLNEFSESTAIGFIENVSVWRFKWTMGPKKGQIETGMIAQEIEPYLPAAVTKRKTKLFDDERLLDIGKPAAFLHQMALKNLLSRVKKLESKIK